MELKYVGPKPLISHTGIEFDNNKEDKYAYLNIAVQLTKAINHDYFEDKKYTYETDTKRLKDNELMDELKNLCPNLNLLMEKGNVFIEEEIQHDIQRARENSVLTKEDKEILENNINIMHDYLVQRSINKRVYYCVIDNLAQMLKKDHIDYVIAPMYQKFAHVFHSIQGSLRRQKFPVDTQIEVYKEGENLLVKLQVLTKK